MSTETLLKLKGVYTRRAGIQVLRDISFEVGNEMVVVLGLNAAGKSTLLRTIIGLSPSNGGSVTFGGRLLTGKPAHDAVALGLGFVPQSGQHFLQLTVERNLRLGGYLLGRRELDAAVDGALDFFPRLKSKRKLPAGVLSGGERQMLAIAKALLSRPRFLLLDEPTAGLAPVAIAGIYEILGSLRGRGLPILMAEQNVAKALEVADRAVILFRGSIQGIVSAHEFRDNPNLTRRLMLGEWSERPGGRSNIAAVDPPD
jgi:ABC-type branched-subunit amino acid transport system ATPase component